MNNQKRERMIRDSVEKARQKGITLVRGVWNMTTRQKKWKTSGLPCACALGCMLYGTPVNTGLLEEDAARMLEAPEYWVEAFYMGFDGDPYDSGPRGAYEMGRILREELEPMEYDAFKYGRTVITC